MAVSYEAWDSQQAAEYETWSLTCHGTLKRVATASSLVPTEEVQTLPVAGDYEAFAAVDEDGDDAADLLAEIGNRMATGIFGLRSGTRSPAQGCASRNCAPAIS